MQKFKKIYDKARLSKSQLKLILALMAFAIVVAVIVFTQTLVNDLIEREQKIVQVYSKIYEYFDIYTDTDDLLFLLEEVTPTITFPIIETDEFDQPTEPFDLHSHNVNFNPSLPLNEQRKFMENFVAKMKQNYTPIIVKHSDGRTLAKFYYTHSSMVDRLRYFPLVAIVIIASFVFVGYIAFSNVRRTEESKVWVGMAKEAAHQLGTPLSSIMAWLEIIKMNACKPDEINSAAEEMENDIKRLNTIATRFSKIGSIPEKKIVEITDLLENISAYFEKRLPHLGRKIEIIRNFQDKAEAQLNVELITWVFENLLKNAGEAIEDKSGEVYLSLRIIYPKKIMIFVRDTGKGMTAKQKRLAFTPGYTTKQRGWGLGLSLCKRIIEEYHDGKIYIKETTPGKGSLFVVEVPLASKEL